MPFSGGLRDRRPDINALGSCGIACRAATATDISRCILTGQVGSYLGLTSGPTMGTDDKPFHLFRGILLGRRPVASIRSCGLTRALLDARSALTTPGTTNLVETVEPETQ